jgi:hypothetical protein
MAPIKHTHTHINTHTLSEFYKTCCGVAKTRPIFTSIMALERWYGGGNPVFCIIVKWAPVCSYHHRGDANKLNSFLQHLSFYFFTSDLILNNGSSMTQCMRHHICGFPKIRETKKNVGFSRHSFFGPKKLQYCLIPAFNNSVVRCHHHHHHYYYYYYYY